MCGIIGMFPSTKQNAEKMLNAIKHRGRDAKNILAIKKGHVGHVLHSIVGEVSQPVQGKGILLFNGQIYNWKEIAAQENISVSNDTLLLLHLLDRYPLHEVRARLDGVYAFAYVRENTIILERDLLGVKPLYYIHSTNVFGFASEAKALKQLGYIPRELHPRTTLTYDLETHKVSSDVREMEFPKTSNTLADILKTAVKKRIPPSRKVGVLFSGGIDSSLIALLLKQAGAKVTLYVAALDDPEKHIPHDLTLARKSAKHLDLPLVEARATLDEVESLIPTICEMIEDSSVVKVGVALPFWLCAQEAKKDAQRVLFSGLGAEEVFAGYQRHKLAQNINAECLRGLRKIHERDLYRDDVVGMCHTLEVRLPFLDHELVAAGLAIPGENKIIKGIGKMPLRNVAQELGLAQEIAMQPKKAAQYGSQFDAAIGKLASRNSLLKSEYLRKIYPSIRKLCALLSTGKDSVYALYVMQQMNYDISCCATIHSHNPDSYMYHGPLTSLAKDQANRMGIPLIEQETAGVKEEELHALRSVIMQAIDIYDVQGVVSGALFSNYQRERIERICEELGIQVYAPLWHLNQEQEVREILDAGFSFILSKVAAQGLDRTWLNRSITHEDIDTLTKKLELNVAGEGGEYESLMIDGPNFTQPLTLPEFEIMCDEEGSVDVCYLSYTHPN